MSLDPVVVEGVTPEIGARPGEVVACTVRVRNDGPSPIPLVVRVHGLGRTSPFVPVGGPQVVPGAVVDITVPLEVPETFGVGSHAVAVEVGTGKPQDRTALAKVVLTIGSPDGITTRIEPSVMRGGRRVRFGVEVTNRNTVRADVSLAATGPDLRIALDRRQITVDPGTTAVVGAKVRGPRRWVGDPAQHVVTVEARSDSVPTYATASYRQRAVLPRRARGGMIGVAFIALWALIAAAVVFVWARDDNDTKDATEQTTGDSLTPLTQPDGSPVTGVDGAGGGSGGDGSSGAGSGGGAGGAGGEAGAAGSSAASATILRGTVKAGTTGVNDGVLVTLTPTLPGDTQQVETGTTSGPVAGDPAAAVLRPGGPGEGMRVVANPAARAAATDSAPTKFWPDRYGTYQPGGLSDVRTLSVASVASNEDGAWQFREVALRHTYEVSFAKPGFTTQSFIVSPPDDGEPVELEVELQPGDGALGGVVRGIPGAAQVSITDGTLTFATTTSTDAADRGRWDVDSLSTPGTYTVTVTSDGYSTEVMQVHLDPGEARTDLNLTMHGERGSIAGTVTANGSGLGGVTVVATTGDEAITTTSLTDGATGTYNFPQLALGSTYTVTASADGYITQTRSVTVNGNNTGIDFALVKSTATVIGRVMSNRSGTPAPLVSATVSVAAGDLQVRTSSAAAPDPGSFIVTDLPPGTYVLAASRYDHPEVSQLVTLAAGQVFDAGDIVLGYETRPPLEATGSLIVRTVKSDGTELPGTTVQLIDVGGTIPTQSKTMPASEASVSFTEIPIGTYNVRVTLANYRPATINQLSIGLGPVERQVTMLQYGTARGTVVDAVAGYEFNGQQVYVTADDPSVSVQFDRNKPIILPPVEEVGEDAVAAYRTVNPNDAPNVAPAGWLVVEYPNGLFRVDTNSDGVPDQPLTLLHVGSRPLSAYELLLYRMNGPNAVCIGAIPETDAEWEIDPSMSLLAGDYVLRFAPLPGEGAGTNCAGRGQAPEGYAVIPVDDQGNVASFTVAEDLDRKVLLGPIAVAPYTQMSGRVVVPKIDNGQVVFDDFAAAQEQDLTITADCDAAGTATADVAAGPGDSIAFTFTRGSMATALTGVPYDATTGAIGACTLHASYGDGTEFIPAEARVNVGVGLSPATGYPDRTLSVALVDDPGTITGTVWWRDLGATGAEAPAHTVGGATVASTDDQVIVGFTAGDEADPDDPDTTEAPTVDPSADRAAVSTTATGGGLFTFAQPGQRQVLGTSQYRVSATSPYGSAYDPYEPLTITAEPGDWSATEVPDRVLPGDGTVDVFLDPPAGSISGNVSITTTNINRPYGELRLTPTAPDGTAGAAVTPDGAGNFRVDPAAAGTWQLEWGYTPGSNLYVTSANPVRQFVGPGEPVNADQVRALELAHIDVAVTDDIGNEVDGNPDDSTSADDTTVTVELDSGQTTQPPTYTATTQTTCGSATDPPCGVHGTTTFDRLPVNAGNPLGAEVTYLVSADVPKHDAATSQVFVTRYDPFGNIVSMTDETPDPPRLTDIPIGVRSGERVSVRFATPGYATISGSIVGQTTPPGWTPQATEPLTIGPDVQVVATRDNGQTYTADAVGTDGDYVIDVPAGTYTVSYSATNYVSPADVGVGTLLPDSITTPTQVPGLDQTLLLQTGTYHLTARVAPDAESAPVADASVQLWWGPYNPLDPPSGTAQYTGTTGGDGTVELSGVYPGSYTLIVRNVGAQGDDNFPVIASITIPRGPEPTGSTTTHRVAMPPVGGSITGTVTAVAASNPDRPVPLPAGISVSRTYDLSQLQGPDVLENEATESDLSPQPTTSIALSETTPGEGTTYDFSRLAYGEHELTFSAADGYTVTPAEATSVVVGDTTEPLDAVYSAANVAVAVSVVEAGGDPEDPTLVTGATVTLVPTDAGQSDPGEPSAAGGVYTFTAAPDLAAYTLHVEAEGYAAVADQSVTVAPNDETQAVEVVLTAVATVTGIAQTQGADGTDVYDGEVQLLADGNSIQTVDTDAGTGTFTFELTSVDDDAVYRVLLEVDGHVSATADIAAGTLEVGESHDVGTLTALEYATATIGLANDPPPTGVDLAVTSTLTGDAVTISALTDGAWTVTALKPGATYSFTVSAENYADGTVADYEATPGGTYVPTAVVLDPLPARATISVANTPVPAGLSLAVTSSLTGDTVAGDHAPTSGGTWELTGLTPGAEYSFVITATDYDTYSGLPDFTASPNGAYTQTDVSLTPKPAAIAVSITNDPVPAGLTLTVNPDSAAIAGDGASTDGTWDVTGLVPGTAYTFTITSDDYQLATFNHTPVANGDATQPAITLEGKPATATITVAGDAGTETNAKVTCAPANITGARGSSPSTNVWTFSIPIGQSCIFTASAPGYTSDSTDSAYVATINGTYVDTLAPVANGGGSTP